MTEPLLSTESIEVVTTTGDRVMVPLYQLVRAHEHIVAKRHAGFIERIQKAVADHYGVPHRTLRSGRRQKHLILPRHVSMYLARELTEFSFPQIARCFGGRDHTSVLYAVERVEALMDVDATVKGDVELLRAMITSNEADQ